MKKLLLIILLITLPAFSAPHVSVIANTYASPSYSWLKIVAELLMFTFTMLSFLIWKRFGKDDPVIPVINFYPPNGMNPAEAEFAYNGALSEKGISAMIIYLASKGYIDIKEEGDTYSIVKLKEAFYAESPVEKIILNALNPFDYSFVTKEDVRSSYIFYDTIPEIINDLNSKKHLIFYKDSININLQRIMKILLAMVIFITISWILCFNRFYFTHPDFNGVIFGLLCIIVCSVCKYHLPKRNNTGNRLLGELLGLKHFIKVAKKHEIEMLVEKNPNYFYDILPYAYVLDVSDKWISKFKDITVLDPNFLSTNMSYTDSNIRKIDNILNWLNQVK